MKLGEIPSFSRTQENDEIIAKAKRKLEYIIEKEGDAGGERRKKQYLDQLIAESLDADILFEATYYLSKQKG